MRWFASGVSECNVVYMRMSCVQWEVPQGPFLDLIQSLIQHLKTYILSPLSHIEFLTYSVYAGSTTVYMYVLSADHTYSHDYYTSLHEGQASWLAQNF